jgi:hypothetical protein
MFFGILIDFRSFLPNYLLNLNFVNYTSLNQEGDLNEVITNISMNADYGTLEKVAEDFKSITKFNRGITYRKMTRGITKIAGG